jgi:hypothetical protein
MLLLTSAFTCTCLQHTPVPAPLPPHHQPGGRILIRGLPGCGRIHASCHAFASKSDTTIHPYPCPPSKPGTHNNPHSEVALREDASRQGQEGPQDEHDKGQGASRDVGPTQSLGQGSRGVLWVHGHRSSSGSRRGVSRNLLANNLGLQGLMCMVYSAVCGAITCSHRQPQAAKCCKVVCILPL